MGGDAMPVRGRDLLHSLLARFTRPLMDMSKFQLDRSDIQKVKSDISARASPLAQKGAEIMSPKVIKRNELLTPLPAARREERQ
jgi:hypothetical protein